MLKAKRLMLKAKRLMLKAKRLMLKQSALYNCHEADGLCVLFAFTAIPPPETNNRQRVRKLSVSFFIKIFFRGSFPPGKNGGLSTALSTFAHFVSPAALCGKIPRAQPGRVCLSRRRLPLRRMNQHINTGGIHGFNSLADKLTAAFPHAEDNGARPSAAICRAVSATRRKACRGGPERLHRVLF